MERYEDLIPGEVYRGDLLRRRAAAQERVWAVLAASLALHNCNCEQSDPEAACFDERVTWDQAMDAYKRDATA